MTDHLTVWEEAARPHGSRPGVPDHIRQTRTAALEAPAARLIELTRSHELMRQYLAEACAEVRMRRREGGHEDRYHRFGGVSFGGVVMAQHFCDLVLWEAILNENPQIRGIVEIGTWQGGFSGWLHAQAVIRGIGFWTCDALAPEREVPGFERVDVWAHPEIVEEEILAATPAILLCDGGNKPRELRTFGPLVHPDGLVVVHDWGTEVGPGDVPDGLTEAYGGFCDELGSVSRVFRRDQ